MSRILTRQLFQRRINSSDSYLINTPDTTINADMYLNTEYINAYANDIT